MHLQGPMERNGTPLHPRDLERIHDERSGQETPSAVQVTGLGGRCGQPGERPGLGAEGW